MVSIAGSLVEGDSRGGSEDSVNKNRLGRRYYPRYNSGYNPRYQGYNPRYQGYNPRYLGYNSLYQGYNRNPCDLNPDCPAVIPPSHIPSVPSPSGVTATRRKGISNNHHSPRHPKTHLIFFGTYFFFKSLNLYLKGYNPTDEASSF